MMNAKLIEEIKAIKDANAVKFTTKVNEALKKGFEVNEDYYIPPPSQGEDFVTILYKFKKDVA